ncbi:cation:dicarboxylase symporter family transporter [Opitutus sp. GAS368]|jgi:proton glutamate symport protein|uniref:dicarboxylate/amino acid:cation symporter n=1 Tax=Opitutus sp. GAS368 TaxID=1882749 RepID=UPI00087B91B2|nr:cation:dicarboxylase symporter family transporter [Opitutus sp. GAS368]SDR99872.1 proton glutamate symport protein [Opitutus sp. GAS368]
MSVPAEAAAPRKWYQFSLTQQILLGLVVGVLLGWWMSGQTPEARQGWNEWLGVVRDIFLHLIKVMIAPLIFASVVQGFAGTGDMKKVGRIGWKALLYFEVVTTFALLVGLVVVNVVKPGAGVVLAANAAQSTAGLAKPLTLGEIITHMFPVSVMDAMARNDVLQVVVFAVLFAMAVIAAGEAGKPVFTFFGSLTQVMFKFAGLIMKFAPFGVGAAIAVTIGAQGLGSLVTLAKLVFTLYGALVIFVVFVFGTVIWLAKVPLRPFVKAVREPFTLAFATANSEAALPKAFENMEKVGVPRGIVGFVLPAGYSFNLDGSTLHLAVASVFVAQAAETTTGIHFTIEQQITMMLVLMLTSKGVAAVPRASFVVLIAALESFKLPLAGAFLILGVDALLDMARTSVNVLGNCLASVVVARWEGEFDDQKAAAFLADTGPKA